MVDNTAVFDADADGNTVVSQMAPPAFVASVFKSAWVDVSAYRRLTGILAMDKASATNGLVIEQSLSTTPPSADADAHYFTQVNDAATLSTNPITGQAYFAAAFSIERVGVYARLVVKHGADVPLTFFAKLIGAGIT